MILGRSNIDFNTLPLGILYITSIPQILIVIGDHANMHVSFLQLSSLGRNIDTVNHYTGDHLLKSILGGYTFGVQCMVASETSLNVLVKA